MSEKEERDHKEAVNEVARRAKGVLVEWRSVSSHTALPVGFARAMFCLEQGMEKMERAWVDLEDARRTKAGNPA